MAFALFWGASSLASPAGGALVDRLGVVVGVRIGAVGVAASALAIAAAVHSALALMAALLLGGIANALSVPGISALVARDVGRGRQAFAFGVGISGLPAASLLAGLAVPTFGLLVGWRWAFVATGVAVLGAAWSIRGPRGVEARGSRTKAPISASLLVVTLGGLIGSAAAGPIASFLVVSGVDAGLGYAPAGILLAVCSALSVASRLGIGLVVDRRGGPLLLGVAGMLAVGAIGYVLLATGEPLAFVAGALLASAFGWGWLALFLFAVFDRHRDAPAAAAGVAQSGLYAGGFLGPLAFGALVDWTSFGPSWLIIAASALVAVGVILLGRAMARAEPR